MVDWQCGRPLQIVGEKLVIRARLDVEVSCNLKWQACCLIKLFNLNLAEFHFYAGISCFSFVRQENALIWQPGPHCEGAEFSLGSLTLHIEIPHLIDWVSAHQHQVNSKTLIQPTHNALG